jgi:hypothetical protein
MMMSRMLGMNVCSLWTTQLLIMLLLLLLLLVLVVMMMPLGTILIRLATNIHPTMTTTATTTIIIHGSMRHQLHLLSHISGYFIFQFL